MKDALLEIGVVVFAVMLGFAAARFAADQIAKAGIPILSGNGSPIPLPAK